MTRGWWPERFIAGGRSAPPRAGRALRSRYGQNAIIVVSATLLSDRLGCDWHPSAHDDRVISGLLTTFIGTLPLAW